MLGVWPQPPEERPLQSRTRAHATASEQERGRKLRENYENYLKLHDINSYINIFSVEIHILFLFEE